MSFDCCADPKPRTSEADGRFFCASCHTWLSVDIDERDGTAHDPTDAEDVGDQERETDDHS